MGEATTIGIVLVKNVFRIHGADEAGMAVSRKQQRRGGQKRILTEALGREDEALAHVRDKGLDPSCDAEILHHVLPHIRAGRS